MSKLAVHDLAVRYGKLTALAEVSFTVAEGERVFISGPNGAGKSSLLSALAGAVRAAHGRIEMDGDILSGLGPEAIARRGLSMVPEGRRIFAGLTVQENLMVGTGMRRDRGAVADDLETVFNAFPILRERARAPAGASHCCCLRAPVRPSFRRRERRVPGGEKIACYRCRPMNAI